MHSNFVKRLLKAAWVLELVVAVLILAVTLLELFLLGEGTLSQVLGGSFSADAFFADAMTIVVGIEFVKMLMLHTPRAVTDVLLFAIARQLVVNHSSAVDTLLGVAAVALIDLSAGPERLCLPGLRPCGAGARRGGRLPPGGDLLPEVPLRRRVRRPGAQGGGPHCLPCAHPPL